MYMIPEFASKDTGGTGGALGGGSSTGNQFMSFPSFTGGGDSHINVRRYNPVSAAPGMAIQSPTAPPPGVVPPSGGSTPSFPYSPSALNAPGGVGSGYSLRGNARTVPTLDPAFTQALDNWLRGQMGQGATPFDLSAFLPSTGGATKPGQVSAPLTPELQQLMKFLITGTGGSPGEQTLGQLAETGLPIDQTPAWQAMIASEQRNIGEGANQLREQFAGFGDLASSDFGKSISDYFTQTALGENAQLTAATAAAQEAARGRQMTAATDLTQLGAGMGEFAQGLDQQSIDALMQEFIRTRPEYSPLLQEEFGFGTTFPPAYTKKSGFGQAFSGAFGESLGTGLGHILVGQ